LIGLIVWHNVQHKAGFRDAIVDNSLLNIAFDPLAVVGRGQRGRGNARQQKCSNPG